MQKAEHILQAMQKHRTPTSDGSGTFVTAMTCAVVRHERMPYGRVSTREMCCKASTLSRPGNRLGSVAWWKRPKFGNPRPTTEGQARLDMARAELPQGQF
jgi:hypothetical protein